MQSLWSSLSLMLRRQNLKCRQRETQKKSAVERQKVRSSLHCCIYYSINCGVKKSWAHVRLVLMGAETRKKKVTFTLHKCAHADTKTNSNEISRCSNCHQQDSHTGTHRTFSFSHFTSIRSQTNRPWKLVTKALFFFLQHSMPLFKSRTIKTRDTSSGLSWTMKFLKICFLGNSNQPRYPSKFE